MKRAILTVSIVLASFGLVLAGQTIIQKGNIITDVFTATTLTVNQISGHLLKGDIDASQNTVKNLADPVDSQDAATKAYVDRKINKSCEEIVDLPKCPFKGDGGSVYLGSNFSSSSNDWCKVGTTCYKYVQDPSSGIGCYIYTSEEAQYYSWLSCFCFNWLFPADSYCGICIAL